jgi:hypothetical protein
MHIQLEEKREGGRGSGAVVGWPVATRERRSRAGGGVDAPHGSVPADRGGCQVGPHAPHGRMPTDRGGGARLPGGGSAQSRGRGSNGFEPIQISNEFKLF